MGETIEVRRTIPIRLAPSNPKVEAMPTG